MKDLKFRYASGKNFICFGEEGIELDFSSLGNIVLIRGENRDVQEEERIASNGCGKSSIPELIVYALYGKTIKFPKKISHKDVINNKTKKKTVVELWWDNYRVIRTRNTSNVATLRLWEAPTADFDWVGEMERLGEEEFDKKYEKTKGGIPATQKEIEKIVGLSYDTFVNVYIFTDHNAGLFLELDTPAKRAFIENLLSLEKYKENGEEAKKLHNSVRDKIKLHSNSYENALNAKTSVKNRITQTEQEEKNWFSVKNKELAALVNSIKAKRQELETSDLGKALAEYEKAQESIKELENNNSEINDKLLKLEEIVVDTNQQLDVVRTERINIQSLLSTIDVEINSIKSDIAKSKKTINDLNNHKEGTKCLHCYGLIKRENYELVIKESNDLIKNCEDKISDLNKKQIDLDFDKVNNEETRLKLILSQANAKKTELINSLNKNKKSIISLSNIKKPEVNTYETLIEGQIDNLKAQAIEKKKEIDAPSPYVKILEAAKKELEDKEAECIAKTTELKEAEEDLPYYAFWLQAFGDDGIRKFIIKDVIPALNAKTNHWLQFLIDGKIKLTFNDQLEENIEREPSDGDPFVYFAMSGGERRRLNLAVSQAFAHIMTLNSNVSPSLVFLDEVTSNIDQIGVVGVYNMIVELSKEKQVFVTTHDQDLLQMLNGCETLNLVKENGITKVS